MALLNRQQVEASSVAVPCVVVIEGQCLYTLYERGLLPDYGLHKIVLAGKTVRLTWFYKKKTSFVIYSLFCVKALRNISF